MTDKTYRLVTGGCSFSKRADLPIMKEQEKTWSNAIEESFDFPFYYHTGEPASGNSLISRRVIYTLSNILKIPNIKSDEIILSVMWSDPIRTDLFASIDETYKWPELTQHKGNTEPLRLGEGFDTSYNQENKNCIILLRSTMTPGSTDLFEKKYLLYFTDILCGMGIKKSLIHLTWEAAKKVRGADEIFVATDDQRIYDAVNRFGGKAIMTSKSCKNGTERCAEAVEKMSANPDIVINFQGDAPLTPPWFIEALIENITDAVIFADIKGNVIYANHQARSICGLDKSD